MCRFYLREGSVLRDSYKDFADMAKQDYEMALRVFEYRDFVSVPFMHQMLSVCEPEEEYLKLHNRLSMCRLCF